MLPIGVCICTVRLPFQASGTSCVQFARMSNSLLASAVIRNLKDPVTIDPSFIEKAKLIPIGPFSDSVAILHETQRL